MAEAKRKRQGAPEKKEIHYTLRHYLRTVITDFTGEQSNEWVLKQALAQMTDLEKRNCQHEAMMAVVTNEIGLASIDKRKLDDDLWADTYLTALMRTAGGSIHVGEATWDLRLAQRERRIGALRRQNARFDLEERRDELLKPIMDGTDKTVTEAVAELQS